MIDSFVLLEMFFMFLLLVSLYSKFMELQGITTDACLKNLKTFDLILTRTDHNIHM